MMRIAGVAATLFLAACGGRADSGVSADAVAAGRAEQKAVADTDAARSDAAKPTEQTSIVPG